MYRCVVPPIRQAFPAGTRDMLLIMYDVVDAMLAGGVAAVLPFMILMMPCMDGVGASSQRIFISKSDTNMPYQRRVEKQH